MSPHIIVPKRKQVNVRYEGAFVQILLDGKLVMDMPYEQALNLAKAIHVQAKKAEEIAAAPQVIMDEALLLRTGMPFSLSANPDIRKEALKEAAWNTPLRRYVRRSKLSHKSGTVWPPTVTRENKD